jgi:hypothetical protein
MPVSPFSLLLPLVFLAFLTWGTFRGKKAFLGTLAGVVAVIIDITVPFYLRGWWLMFCGSRGDGAALYELARWHENHCERIGVFILWPGTPDVMAGYRALERGAAMGYPPATYALGVRLKYGDYVPEPPGWTGPNGNVFPQPDKGQPLIDQALRAGYKPKVEERRFYWQEFRK